MIAIYLAPVYLLLNLYILRWAYLWMGTCHSILRTLTFRVIFAIIYILLSTSLLSGFLIKKPRSLHQLLKITSNYFLGIFLYILMIVLAADLGRLLFKYAFHASWIHSRMAFTVTGAICTVLIITLSARGIFHAKYIKTTPYDVTIEKQIPGKNSLRIILLADTHFGYNAGVLHARELVRKINKQQPDLVCIAGDIFDNEYDAIRDPERLQKVLRGIKSTYGVYACWGNHDLNEEILAGFTFKHKGEDTAEVKDPRMKEFLEASDIHILEDEAVLINNSFYVIGRKDASLIEKIHETRKAPAQLTKELDRSKPIIVIDHQPKELQELADAGVDLDLCGHTHDGQTFPGNFTIRLMWENPCGLLTKDAMTNITTSGAGVWGPAMRIGTDCEICSIDLHFK
ncbi:metallophosphoesterase [Blautia sp. MSJ-19]|uniref:metallophosphoesterase n=1 Tax=Blautia sp. MSJ-19 TaxID=2841517 RepID=UPI001C0EB1AB|nr:metallophosphoesterase [Blautia sp. MSJ-19]MBU5482239.1 metallophosphoesterase [Blautia sp. MSJ-19]